MPVSIRWHIILLRISISVFIFKCSDILKTDEYESTSSFIVSAEIYGLIYGSELGNL